MDYGLFDRHEVYIYDTSVKLSHGSFYKFVAMRLFLSRRNQRLKFGVFVQAFKIGISFQMMKIRVAETN